jgi:hypothetical protein
VALKNVYLKPKSPASTFLPTHTHARSLKNGCSLINFTFLSLTGITKFSKEEKSTSQLVAISLRKPEIEKSI